MVFKCVKPAETVAKARTVVLLNPPLKLCTTSLQVPLGLHPRGFRRLRVGSETPGDASEGVQALRGPSGEAAEKTSQGVSSSLI